MIDRIQNEFFHSIQTGAWGKHFDGGHVLAAKAFGTGQDRDLVPGDNAGMDNRGCVVSGVDAVKDGVADNGFSQISPHICFADALIDSIFKGTAFYNDILSVFYKKDCQPGVLTEGDLLLCCNFAVFDQLFNNTFANRGFLCF